MQKQQVTYKLIIMLFVVFAFQMVTGQSYQKDSLQIKAYTEIEYRSGEPKGITLKKVFCDYCSEKQLQLLGEEAVRRADGEKYDPKNTLKNGKKKLAVYIRIAKTDFAAIKEDE